MEFHDFPWKSSISSVFFPCVSPKSADMFIHKQTPSLRATAWHSWRCPRPSAAQESPPAASWWPLNLVTRRDWFLGNSLEFLWDFIMYMESGSKKPGIDFLSMGLLTYLLDGYFLWSSQMGFKPVKCWIHGPLLVTPTHIIPTLANRKILRTQKYSLPFRMGFTPFITLTSSE